MKRFSVCVLMATMFLVANSQPLSAMVMFVPIGKGDVPPMIQNPDLRKALSVVPPLGGTSTVGSWNHCTLYYRGTQQSLQQLLEQIGQIENVQIRISIDPSGKVGKVESTKFRPLTKTLIYQFSVSTSGYPLHNAKNSSTKETVWIRIHESNGIDTSKLRLPKSAHVLSAK